jgi:tetratricopeptide (TPR) repeat protein
MIWNTLISAAALATALCAPLALAQGTDPIASEALFQEGNRLFDAGNFAEACPKLAESYRLEPGTGTLLKLALCHEREGKLASAWTELNEALGRSKREGDSDREQYARERIDALQPRLSSLTIQIAPELMTVPGLEVKRDDVALGKGSWNLRLPIDGGQHAIEVSAPGKQPHRQLIIIANEADAAEVSIRALQDSEQATAPPLAERPSGPALEADTGADSDGAGAWGSWEWAGIATAGAGVVGLGLGGYFLADALDKDGKEVGAEDQGNLATLCGALGGALVLGGATMFIVGRTSAEPSEPKPNIGLALSLTPQSWTAGIRGSL